MEYAASLVKQQINMKMYMRGDLFCSELTREIKTGEIKKLFSNIYNPNKNALITKQNGKIVMYIPNFVFDGK
jgi:hypothetical protein